MKRFFKVFLGLFTVLLSFVGGFSNQDFVAAATNTKVHFCIRPVLVKGYFRRPRNCAKCKRTEWVNQYYKFIKKYSAKLVNIGTMC